MEDTAVVGTVVGLVTQLQCMAMDGTTTITDGIIITMDGVTMDTVGIR